MKACRYVDVDMVVSTMFVANGATANIKCSVLLQPQKRHLRQPAASAVFVEGGNVYVIPNT